MKIHLSAMLLFGAFATLYARNPQVTTCNGIVEGITINGTDIYKGIPFAAPPIGNLRWKAPQPAENWEGVRKAYDFGPNPMQQPVFGDMNFGTPVNSEDCLYLNIWRPSDDDKSGLPVLIYFNGGALIAGSGSEPRYSGKTLAQKGIIVITANYREGIFGFFSHPGLSAETSYNGSGNYGFMDQLAAIRWVKDNIRAFGGDPDKITVAGESAGSISVSALMASPLSEGLFSQAIGSSGSALFYNGIPSLEEAEKSGMKKAALIGCESIEELREMPAEELLEKSQCYGMMPYNIDGYVLKKQPLEVYDSGLQMDIPLLIGGNSEEMGVDFILEGKPAVLNSIRENVSSVYGDSTDRVLELYGITTDEDVNGEPGVDLASDIFIGYSTWKWTDACGRSAKNPVYRYIYCHPRPEMKIKGKTAGLAGGIKDDDGSSKNSQRPKGAVHSADIEYAMGNLDTNDVYDWQPDDYKMSEIFSDYYANFVKSGNPNGDGLTFWPPINGKAVPPVLRLDVESEVMTNEELQKRYFYVDSLLSKQQIP